MRACNLIKNPELFLKLTPWEKSEILRPFRRYYSRRLSIKGLNPRRAAILLTRAETGADTYTTALYLSQTLRSKITSLQAVSSWKKGIDAETLIRNLQFTPASGHPETIYKAIFEGLKKALPKLDGLQIENTRSKLPHWLIKTHISKMLSKHTTALTEWSSKNKRYDIYLPLNDLKIEVKYVWGYSVNYREYIENDKDIYMIVGENVSWKKLSLLSAENETKYILYRTDLDEVFSNVGEDYNEARNRY
ncbi:hypothetical protein [Thermococcus sp. Bubb.Bath]|uniref:hypothetical protein n=1 Tax=Thermococcus sp. Bubb.Bath TaxID=1638242 RepID=UPI00143C2D53|nr:hypothetical protein [Thermococcus sp. Bubb.Bath]NJF24888.1 hypothetical protein [Thermococcus sp. Bubb.Bath]